MDDNGNMRCRGDVVQDAADFGESIPLFAHMHGGYACDFWPTDRTDAPSDEEVREFLKTNPDIAGEIEAKLRAKLLDTPSAPVKEEALEAEA